MVTDLITQESLISPQLAYDLFDIETDEFIKLADVASKIKAKEANVFLSNLLDNIRAGLIPISHPCCPKLRATLCAFFKALDEGNNEAK